MKKKILKHFKNGKKWRCESERIKEDKEKEGIDERTVIKVVTMKLILCTELMMVAGSNFIN